MQQISAEAGNSDGDSALQSSFAAITRIRNVIQTAVVPSWLKKSSIPGNFGEAAAGTLKANEWRILATLYIPIALISIWGLDTEHPSPSIADRQLKVLSHTMSLVSAVRLVFQTSTDKERAERYLENITTYVGDLKIVHPDTLFVPNHHMAFHIYDCLHLFGPAYLWWTFPFERMIGQLQCVKTKNRLGIVLKFTVYFKLNCL